LYRRDGRRFGGASSLSDGTVIQQGDVLILDFGCDVEGYKSDITRTVSIGRASDESKKVYEIVYRAHMAARNAIVRALLGSLSIEPRERSSKKLDMDRSSFTVPATEWYEDSRRAQYRQGKCDSSRTRQLL